MKKCLILILSLSITAFSNAGNDNHAVGARGTGMGNTGLCLSDVWSVKYNQAGLANVKFVTAGVSYESRFLSNELGLQSFGLAIPTKAGTFGLSYTGFGGRLYNESKFGLAYGMKLSSVLSGGLSINYHNLRIGNNYGTSSTFTFELGVIAKVIDNLKIGIHVFNPTESKLNEYQNELIPVVFNLGLNYTFSDKVFVNAEVEKDIDFKPVFKVGLEYHPLNSLYLRAGVSSNPSLPSIGFGVDLKQFRFDFSSSFHAVLGATPAFALIYSFK